MAASSTPGYSINPASTGAQGLEQYFDNTNKSAAGGFRAPIINIATGGSKLSPDISATGGSDWSTYAMIAGGLAALYIWKKNK